MVQVDIDCKGSDCSYYRKFYNVDKIKNSINAYTPNFNLPPNENCTYGLSPFSEGVSIGSLKKCPQIK